MSSNKIGIWGVTSLVISSQLGSGVFTLPSSLSEFGSISLFGWLVSGTGAILLALVFSYLCMKMPKTGGPHVYVEAAFGKKVAFYISWTYWLISWISSAAVITAATEFIQIIVGNQGFFTNLLIEIFILLIITLINLKGMVLASVIELVLTILKCVPLIILPIGGIIMLNPENFSPLNPTNLDDFSVINKASLFTLWGFIGLESATTTTGFIHNPAKIVPKAVVMGTVFVAIIYILNSVGIMGLIPAHDLVGEGVSAYAKAAHILFGNRYDVLIAIIGFIVCIGTLNAWVLTSGQIALGAAQDQLLPKFFGLTNKYGSPYASIILSFFGTIPLLVITLDQNLCKQVMVVIELSVTAFLFIYVACMLSFLKLKIGNKRQKLICLGAICFCLWALNSVNLKNSLFCTLFIISGIPIYFWQKRQTS